MTGHSSWFAVVAGAVAIITGLYVLLQTGSVASWLENQGIRHAVATAAFLRQIKTLGFLFILAGGFFLAVAVRN